MSTIYVSDLYRRAILDPLSEGADTLKVVSGYATASMASQLLSDARDRFDRSLSIELVVGMTGLDGIQIEAHRGFESLTQQPPAGTLAVKYMPNGTVAHTKLYVWLRGTAPLFAFAGSSNFTHNGFLLGRSGARRIELLTDVPTKQAIDEYNRIEALSIAIDHPDLGEEVTFRRQIEPPTWSEVAIEGTTAFSQIVGADSVILPLVMTGGRRETRGMVHQRSGLNWGQRPEYRREPNQAYIPIPARIAVSNFFPPRGDQFLVSTDDHKAIIMVVAEDNGKALHSPQGNQLIGEYFRNRLGVPNGARVEDDDLIRFGSRFVRFYKTDDESYFMEYSPDVEADGIRFYEI